MIINPKHIFLSIGILLICLYATSVRGQIAPDRLADLIKQTNEIILTPMAHGVLLSPYEILQHNRSRFINNIQMVDSIEFITKSDTIPIFIQNNQTIIHRPDERFNARTYIYHKDGRIDKVLRGRHIDDQYLYDKSDYLIQHGHGGELKKASRNGKTFEWYKVNNGELVYATSYDERDRLVSLKTQGQYNVEYDLENYTWNETKVASKNSIIKYKQGSADTTYMAFEYDSLGLIQSINSREDIRSHWSKIEITSKIDYLPSDLIRIELFAGEVKSFSITFDQYDNWVELENFNQLKKRNIIYRRKRRKK